MSVTHCFIAYYHKPIGKPASKQKNTPKPVPVGLGVFHTMVRLMLTVYQTLLLKATFSSFLYC